MELATLIFVVSAAVFNGATATNQTIANVTSHHPNSSICPFYGEHPNWFEDGYCDDQLNTEECHFDGGDCCDSEKENWNSFCIECVCKNKPNLTTCPIYVKCRFGDGICDDEMNTEGCLWDGGDCCPSPNQKENWNKFCTECQCKGMEPVCHVENSCRLGDGFCDDFLNTPNCGFDQGDCCGNENPGWNSYCHECKCHEDCSGPDCVPWEVASG